VETLGGIAETTGVVFLHALGEELADLVSVREPRICGKAFFCGQGTWDQGDGQQRGGQHLGHQNLLPGRSTVVVTVLEQDRRPQGIPPSDLHGTRILLMGAEIGNGAGHRVGGGV
jgi:hypothetical protein